MRAWVPAAVAGLVVGVSVGVVASGCGGGKQSEPDKAPAKQAGRPRVAVPEPGEPEPETVPDFPDGTRSLELIRTVGVRLEPGDDAKRIGTVAIDTRVGWVRTQKAKGCQKPWVEIKPRGWICSDYVKPSTRMPFGREVPMLDRGELVPGIYGKVTAPASVTYTFEKPKKPDREKKPKDKKTKPDKPDGPITSTAQVTTTDPAAKPEPKLVESRPLVGSVNVRQYEELTIANKVYWRISQKDPEYVLRQAITPHKPSVYGGTRMSDDTGLTLPIAFVWPRVPAWGMAVTTYKPNAGGIARKLPSRTPLALLETAADKAGKPTAYRIADEEWIAAADVRIFAPAPPPPLLDKDERWIDIDVDNQILVAYEGDLPVYATMVSTGGKETPTELGIYRMWLKESEADMKGLNGEDPYSVATVPWTQFFSPEKGLALHTAYWHDQFGVRRSHGCVNLAPRDARWLYFWSEPQVPPGWTMTAGVVESPGSIVRVRSKDNPQPEIKGYAKKVQEARQANAPVQ
ncbi:MAG TPA: L,D-transpeptidase [Kofleriaceae bacterium]|nr:L,D-transpeptidase [Kofleriaceae bacterium]